MSEWRKAALAIREELHFSRLEGSMDLTRATEMILSLGAKMDELAFALQKACGVDRISAPDPFETVARGVACELTYPDRIYPGDEFPASTVREFRNALNALRFVDIPSIINMEAYTPDFLNFWQKDAVNAFLRLTNADQGKVWAAITERP
jgi:hypothetical protein